MVCLRCMSRTFLILDNETPITKSESCSIIYSFFPFGWTFCLSFWAFLIRDVIEHAREIDPVKKTFMFVPSFQHEHIELLQYFLRSVTWKHVPPEINWLTFNVIAVLAAVTFPYT